MSTRIGRLAMTASPPRWSTLCLAALAACGTASPLDGSDKHDDVESITRLEIGEPAGGFDVAVSEAELRADILTVTLEHAGGCGEHRYHMFWDGLVLETFPPQVRLVTVDETEDACEALLARRVSFDLSPLRDALGGSEDTIILAIANYTGSSPIYDLAGATRRDSGIPRR